MLKLDGALGIALDLHATQHLGLAGVQRDTGRIDWNATVEVRRHQSELCHMASMETSAR
ncbi:hypothetical protein GCM10007874_21920 [Labrys miyagiensis]|uniref:Uncharacterized protein n=1 Tax=Labrys miyagiensis TaxID=346912 RepID=A0ABQ6CG96_9HYPH|nr:hypothetical protein GCM10007874_21920 [Labrys miyagiensis]